jgi:hypothetical protein
VKRTYEHATAVNISAVDKYQKVETDLPNLFCVQLKFPEKKLLTLVISAVINGISNYKQSQSHMLLLDD